ncbi:MAG: hypothetical protein A2075_01785 [Geobacteraceae bacterium GWC2_58_44]|nr:MAG: hypothetical protein A2075_01785 [Geobacteraceae bacterium GWC2_58_44]HBG04897.1 hypothetical protein [Geobacter sp.]
MKRIISAVLAMAIVMVSLQGCYGKMSLTRKVYKLNGEVSDKYLRSFVTWVFVLAPVYTASVLADFILFNTIEFWSGKNPIAAGEKNFQYSENGQTYKINARKSGDTITYRINHYNGDTYLDTLSIDWDTKSGNSRATLHESGKVTEFQAILEKGVVRVLSSVQGVPSRAPETVMLRN